MKKATKLEPKKIFNQNSTEEFNEAKILNGNPNGILNFNKTNHGWATDIYKKMEARTWFPKQVNIAKDKNNYRVLSAAKKRSYDLTLAQLIADDSMQTNQLMDRINSYITSPIVNACISRQSSEEGTHSYSYSVMAEDIADDTDLIYDMHNRDIELRIKNAAVERMYETLYKVYKPTFDDVYPIIEKMIDDNIDKENYTAEEVKDIIKDSIKLTINAINDMEYGPTDEDMLLAFIANQILEELVFPGGFTIILSLANDMPGSAEMIAEINFYSLPVEKSAA